jgi:hypothetical protein
MSPFLLLMILVVPGSRQMCVFSGSLLSPWLSYHADPDPDQHADSDAGQDVRDSCQAAARGLLPFPLFQLAVNFSGSDVVFHASVSPSVSVFASLFSQFSQHF